MDGVEEAEVEVVEVVQHQGNLNRLSVTCYGRILSILRKQAQTSSTLYVLLSPSLIGRY